MREKERRDQDTIKLGKKKMNCRREIVGEILRKREGARFRGKRANSLIYTIY